MTDDVYDVNKRAYHHGDLRRALIAAADEILNLEGLEALSLRATAKRAGVSAMAPYRHFADKAALLDAVAEQGFILLGQRLAPLAKLTPSAETLSEMGVVTVLFAAERPDLFRLMFGRPPTWRDEDTSALAMRPETVFGMLMAQVRALHPPNEVEMAFLTSWAFIHGLAYLIVDRRVTPFPPDIEALTRQATAYFAGKVFQPSRAP